MSSYPNYPPPPMMQQQQTSTMAIVSLIAGIAGFSILPILGSIVAVITGHMAKSEIRNSAGRLSGDGLATGGLILGYIGVGLSLIGCCLFLLSFLGVFTIPFCMIPFSSFTY